MNTLLFVMAVKLTVRSAPTFAASDVGRPPPGSGARCEMTLDDGAGRAPLTNEILRRAERQADAYLASLARGAKAVPTVDAIAEWRRTTEDLEWIRQLRALIERAPERINRVRSLAAGGFGREVEPLALFAEGAALAALKPEARYLVHGRRAYEVKWTNEVHQRLFQPSTRRSYGRVFVEALARGWTRDPDTSPHLRVRRFRDGVAALDITVFGRAEASGFIAFDRVEVFERETSRHSVWDLVKSPVWRSRLKPGRGYVIDAHADPAHADVVAFSEAFVHALTGHPRGHAILAELASALDREDDWWRDGERVELGTDGPAARSEGDLTFVHAKGRMRGGRLELSSFEAR